MAYYLAEFVGVGTAVDHYRPPVDGSWGIIDLRGDSTVQAGRCLLWHPDGSLSDPRLEKVADTTVESIPRNISRRIENVLGVTLDQFDTLQAIIAELLILHGSFTDPGRWNPLQTNRLGRHVIHLGGKIYDAPAPVGATITDDFNRADADPISASAEGWSWVEVGVDAAWEIISNEAVHDTTTGDLTAAVADSSLSSDDIYAEHAVPTKNPATNIGPAVRFPDTSTLTCYQARMRNNDHNLIKIETGSGTDLTSLSGTPAAGATMRVEADGSTISGSSSAGWSDSATDTAISGNNLAGMVAFRGQTDADNFEAGESFDPANLVALASGSDVALTWDL